MSEVIEPALNQRTDIYMGRSHVDGGQSPTTTPFYFRNIQEMKREIDIVTENIKISKGDQKYEQN